MTSGRKRTNENEVHYSKRLQWFDIITMLTPLVDSKQGGFEIADSMTEETRENTRVMDF